ncbi:related to Bet1-like protein-Laccaria bicolor [Serendipita indica DSM 11827]|uniref:Related to Bet1-like protein-Laccaria bicolor n=1 Tax=Serendipita indica (strain DSM 11827) TaxID=1109443 RepID=G4TPV0_SERID|nr:related to Bet1-like protein-Laccaria bicolor [Serendipita indica DSM 11827]
MASSQRDAYTYESQNDQRLDELHSKIRTLRGVTTDIHDDVERQNLMLDDTSNSFTAFASSLSQSTRNFTRAFGGTKTWRIMLYVCGVLNGIRLQLACYGSYNTTFFTPYSSHAALHLVELTLTYLSSVLRIQLGDLHNLIVNIIHIYWRKLSY